MRNWWRRTMATNNPHSLNRLSVFALFCLSYIPLFLLLALKIYLSNRDYLHFGGFSLAAFFIFLKKFGFIIILALLSLYAFVGTALTFKRMRTLKSNATPITIVDIKSKNEEALSYLATYVIPLIAQDIIGLFEYVTFAVMFFIYYRLYSTSSLILINPILNIKYGLHSMSFKRSGGSDNIIKDALMISAKKDLEEGDRVRVMKLSHRLYFVY